MNYSKGKHDTILSSARYGNVLASTGSIISFFRQKIKDGEPIPLTHPEMTRFIITADQAVELGLKALVHSIGGEVIIPSIPSAKTIDLIEALKTAMDADNEIVEIGIRPGEKIHEVLINEFEIPLTYEFENIFVITSLIEKYRAIETAIYRCEGRKIDRGMMNEYSSKNRFLTQGKFMDYLRKSNLL